MNEGTKTKDNRLRGRFRKKSKCHSNIKDSIGWRKKHTLSEANSQGKLEMLGNCQGKGQ